MKKGIAIILLLFLAITTAMISVPHVSAATVVIHDEPTDVKKPTEECSEVIRATDGVLAGHYVDQGDDVWLRGWPYGTPTGSVTVQPTITCYVLCIQFRSSDVNDGIADIYVDDMANPVARIDTYMRGHWYVEIGGLPCIHTVRVKASDNHDFTGVYVSPHHATPDIDHTGDLDVWYFCFGVAVGGLVAPVDKFGLLAPYIGLASTIVIATAATAIYVKRVKRREEK